jgi:ADP-ribose pyrophosphatase
MFTPHHNIPDNAECVFNGVRSEVYQWDQTMYDGSLARFERVRFLDGAFVIAILPDNRILITEQSQPWRSEFLSLPGGSFDFPEEDPQECAVRELLEETGYVSDELVPWLRFDGTSNVMTYTHFFIARNCQKIQDIEPDSGERIELVTVTFDEFLELSSNHGFHHHWNLLPILYEARLSSQKKEELKKIFYCK